MSQHDYNLANASGAAFRSDANDALGAAVTWNSGATAPSTMFARQRWADTTASVIRRRNAANSAWLIESTQDEARFLIRTSNTILGVSDIGKCVNATGTWTQTLDAAATLTDGWHCKFVNGGTGIITIDPNAGELIAGGTTLKIYAGESCDIRCTGSAFVAAGYNQSNFKIIGGTRDMTAASGSVAYTGVGFKPRAVILIGGVPDVARMSVGFNTAAAAGSIYDENGVVAGAYNQNGTNSIVMVESAGVSQVFALSSFDDDGFTGTWTKAGSPAAGTAAFYALCIR